MMDPNELAKFFDDHYFAHGCGEPYQRSEIWLNLFDSFAEEIATRIRPRTVLDAGCAFGFLVESLRKRGVQAFGLDLSEYAIQNVHPDIRSYCWIGSVNQPFPQKYDLIVSIEVLEHLPQLESEEAVENLCAHTDEVLFSSTPFDYKEATHFNVQPPEYWAELFARQGFLRDVDFDASFITPWAVRYCRRSWPPARVVREVERRFWLVWKENKDLRSAQFETQRQLAAYEANLANQAQQLAERDRELTDSSQSLVEYQSQVVDLNSRLEQANQRIALMQNSRGWRFLEILRRLLKRVP